MSILIDTLLDIAMQTWTLYLEAAPWLVLGVAAAGLIHAFLPEGLLAKWLGGRGVGPVIKGALIGAPLPLCSCGVLPAAVELRQGGASKSATVSFLIATPETGPDSVAVSYALLGPFLAVVRPIAAVLSATLAGLLTLALDKDGAAPAPPPSAKSCCDGDCTVSTAKPQGLIAKARYGLIYAATEVMDDIATWLLIGLLVAGVVTALVPPMAMADWGGGLPAMLGMLVFGVPIYVCATASTPIAAALIAAGVSPGAALVFLLTGPATNIATLGVVAKDLGPRALAAYLIGIAGGALVMGLATDALISALNIDISVQIEAAREAVPPGLELLSALILLPLMVRAIAPGAFKR